LPGTLKIICDYKTWLQAPGKVKCFPYLTVADYTKKYTPTAVLHFVSVFLTDADANYDALLARLKEDKGAVIVLGTDAGNGMQVMRGFVAMLLQQGVNCPVILSVSADADSPDRQLIKFATDCGGLLLDGMGDGVLLLNNKPVKNVLVSGRTYLEVKSNEQFLNNTAFSILQATRTRISKTEYISCPSCGRTLFDLQETTARIRAATYHLKGVKIAIMGCIVNGPGEMADADFGYVGSGPGKITLYRGKEVVKRNVPSETAVDELIGLLKENDAWVDMPLG
jgi:(E)-4-hydroxy-3-methylbut-2-enyl-diphosphate synthase